MSIKLNLVETKITNESDISTVIKCAISNDWKKTFESASEELNFLSQIIKKNELANGISYPNKENIFRAFQLTKLADVKVVFLNSEPYAVTNYDGSPLANGLAFSVNEDCTIPKELSALYMEVALSVEGFKIPNHGNLTKWALEGVLLLNLSLTVSPNNPRSHGEIWIGFIAKVIETLAVYKPNVPFVLFGESTKKVANLISGQSLIISTTSPSHNKFTESECIKKVISQLEKNKVPPIDWEIK